MRRMRTVRNEASPVAGLHVSSPPVCCVVAGTSRDTHHEDRLSGLIICRECQGAGTIHEEYNHMVISKTCRMCDGDGIRPRPGHTASADVSAAATSRAVKRALGQADDDDELDIPDDLPPLETA